MDGRDTLCKKPGAHEMGQGPRPRAGSQALAQREGRRSDDQGGPVIDSDAHCQRFVGSGRV